jgi:hypothetical protein
LTTFLQKAISIGLSQIASIGDSRVCGIDLNLSLKSLIQFFVGIISVRKYMRCDEKIEKRRMIFHGLNIS